MEDDSQKIETFFRSEERWPAELSALRKILVDCGLVETFKWRSPCYTHNGGNVATLWSLKDNAAIGFFKGVLLNDPEGLLVAPGEHSRSMRVFRFGTIGQIQAQESDIRGLAMQAIRLEETGATVDMPKDDIEYPEELVAALEEDPQFQAAFEALTPGRKRGYALHFGQPKQSATRRSRIDRNRARILVGKGMHDR